jgi:acetylornithine deacetylase/succinyl-diaminopimelate desuccinylase-like protein
LLNQLKDEHEHIQIPGFYDRVRSPSALDLEYLERLPSFERLYKDMYSLGQFILDRQGINFLRSVFEPTCNIQGITTGYQMPGMKTVIPARASVKIDFRLVPDQDPDEIQACLRSWLDQQGYADVELIRHGAMWPYKASADDPFIELTHSTAEEVYGQPTQVDPLSGGSSPIYAFARPLGDIPVVFAGCSYWDNCAHAPDEHIRIPDFLNGARHIARILNRFADL